MSKSLVESSGAIDGQYSYNSNKNFVYMILFVSLTFRVIALLCQTSTLREFLTCCIVS